MPSPSTVIQTGRTRFRTVGRSTSDVALIFSSLRRIFHAEKTARGKTMLEQHTRRFVGATGVSRNREIRVGQEISEDALPASGDLERRASKRRIPA